MDNVIRLSKFVKNLGIVTTVLFLIIVLVTFVTGNMGVAICFMPFVFLGIALILAYKKQIIVVNEDEIVFSYLVKKTQHIKYNDIRCILMIPLNGRTDVILIDKMYNRLVTLEQVYVNYDILYDTLIKHEIDLVDFGELVEQNKDVSKYVPALNWIEKNFYKSICNENTTIKNMSKTIEKEKRKKTKQFLKALGCPVSLLPPPLGRRLVRRMSRLPTDRGAGAPRPASGFPGQQTGQEVGRGDAQRRVPAAVPRAVRRARGLLLAAGLVRPPRPGQDAQRHDRSPRGRRDHPQTVVQEFRGRL